MVKNQLKKAIILIHSLSRQASYNAIGYKLEHKSGSEHASSK